MLTHKGTQTIYTKRLVLRRFTVDDAQAMFNTWANDERVTRYLSWHPHESIEMTKAFLVLKCALYNNLNTYNWAIEYKGILIGNVSVVRLNEDSEWVDLGYCIGYDYWNRGFMTEAIKAVIDFLFSKIRVNRIGISHAVKNPASGKVAQKCGLVFEGVKREYFKKSDEGFLDIASYGITRSEWEMKVTEVSEV